MGASSAEDCAVGEGPEKRGGGNPQGDCEPESAQRNTGTQKMKQGTLGMNRAGENDQHNPGR